ncbi:SIR2 family protein [Flagellimonas lutaonensis]|uniref:Uncharacterized protein n=1 Tax=Flagellimonas lutaonensis TaxID=516051 RepID=A0A0D5YPW0_9FLAO|nr:SIR2 family protein [Allomuricauda lutaonensis]AKA33913.1 hypothetical protein VC82_226 [Allomuricauda lutaonensis]
MEIEFRDNAVNFLAKSLYQDSLSLFVGAGISKSFEVDDWKSLLNNLNKDEAIGLPLLEKERPSADEFQIAADKIVRELKGDEKKLIELISKYLYNGLNLESQKYDIFQHKALNSIAGLIIGGRRGRVKTVFTLNYDSLLEWYLSSFGLIVNSVSELPYFSAGHDVEIFHPHGYVPHPIMDDRPSKEIILSKSQADQRLGEDDSQWSVLVKHYLSKNNFLFIGMSEATSGDRLIAPLLRKIKNKVDRDLGVWIFIRDVDVAIKEELRDLRIAPLILDKDEVPKFLMDISTKAMKIALDNMN